MADEIWTSPTNVNESSNTTQRVNNDPWSPTPSESSQFPKLPQAPFDPLRSLISSETYIESLEKRLQKVKGKTNREVKASAMIQSLQSVKEIQMAQMMHAGHEIFRDETDTTNSSVVSSIQRHINPEKQAINPQELVPLIHEDILAKLTEESHQDTATEDMHS